MRISDWSSDVCSSDLWYWFVLPALMLNYLGQGALVLEDPTAIRNPFYIGVPDWARLPMIILATAATVIASQAVITGAFSDRKSVVAGTSVSVRVDLGGRRIRKKKNDRANRRMH